MVKVKICGITNETDALTAVEEGADAIGFVFVTSSPRRLTLEKAIKISGVLPPFVVKVGVFVNETIPIIEEIVRQCGLSAVQLHGDETPALCQKIYHLPLIKSFRINKPDDIKILASYPLVRAYLLDSFIESKYGGTGKKFNWELAENAKKYGRNIILAGGLTSKNVKLAVQKIKPYGVDVSTGVESKPGKKEKRKIREFIKQVRNAKV